MKVSSQTNALTVFILYTYCNAPLWTGGSQDSIIIRTANSRQQSAIQTSPLFLDFRGIFAHEALPWILCLCVCEVELIDVDDNGSIPWLRNGWFDCILLLRLPAFQICEVESYLNLSIFALIVTPHGQIILMRRKTRWLTALGRELHKGLAKKEHKAQKFARFMGLGFQQRQLSLGQEHADVAQTSPSAVAVYTRTCTIPGFGTCTNAKHFM